MSNKKKNVKSNKKDIKKPDAKKNPKTTGSEKGGYGFQIAIGVVGIIALVLLILVLIPSNGELAGTLTGTDFNGDGSAIRIRADINNDTNKVAFGVTYEFVVTSESGEVVGTFTSDKIGIMFPGSTKSVEEFIYFDNQKIDTGDVEIKVNGYIIGE